MRIRGGINVLPRIRVYPAEAAAREEARPRFTVDLAGHRVLDADGTVLAGAWTRFETFMRERGLTEADLDGLLIENEAGSVRVRRYRAGR